MFSKISTFNFVFASLFLFFVMPLFSQNFASNANRRTAVRYLTLANTAASEKKWEAVKSHCEMGLCYDDKIADLWYLRAIAESNTNGKKIEVLRLVTKSLTEGNWVSYNRDSARILYADILCMTGKEDLVFSVLDSEPMLYSSDAEFIRAKAYYKLGDESSIEKARAKIDTARKIYPADTRFPLLFFKFEYKKNKDLKKLPDNARKLADYFIGMVPKYKDAETELEIFSAIFAQGEKRTRLLKSFNARNLRHILYAKAALEDGLLNQENALDYFLTFAGSDNPLDFDDLLDFVPLITNEDSKKYFSEVLNAFNGTILFDTDGDLVSNLTAEYNRGRPTKVTYDENQDDEILWAATCDFGVPTSVKITEGNLELFYGNWPAVEKVVYYGDLERRNVTFNLMAETLLWTPFLENSVPEIKVALDLDFYVPELVEGKLIDADNLLLASSSYDVPTNERKGATITFSLLDGILQTASYSVDGEIYAQALFENGLPVSRSVDRDGDGLFETTEFYGFDSDLQQNHISESDEMQVLENLFGVKEKGSGFYVKMIQIDNNADTYPDFTEEYLLNGGKITSWDNNFDGLWDYKYILHGDDGSGIVKEEAIFHAPIQDAIVSVYSENGEPRIVKNGNVEMAVFKDSFGIFWLRQKGSEDDAKNVLKYINQNPTSGVCNIVESGEKRMLVILTGKSIIAEFMDKLTVDSAKK